jgi:hypothetical protein
LTVVAAAAAVAEAAAGAGAIALVARVVVISTILSLSGHWAALVMI